ncbi:putative protein kinase RLK-Pelle-L-LEC family [Helianthus anomalus]
MALSMSHFITSILLVLIPVVASFSFNLTNIGPQNLNREIVTEGDGYITNDGIQLTPDGIGSNWTQQAGRATFIRPLHLWDNRSGELASFSTNFTFVIDAEGRTRYGDGITFFLAQNNSVMTSGRAMGLPVNYTTNEPMSRFIAVEFDSFWNGIDANASGNITLRDHVGIDINSLVSVRSQKWLSNVTSGGVCQAWIRYDSVSRNLSVSFTGYQNNTVVRQEGLVYTVDLRNELPEWVIFGFSAATGFRFQKQNVRSWAFDGSDLQADENNEIKPNPSPVPLNGKKRKVGLIVGLSVPITLLVVLAFVWWRWKKGRENVPKDIAFDEEMNYEFEMGTGAKRFSYHELALSTNHFAEKEKLGEGGFGGVYRGLLKDSSTYVAVKRVSKSSKQGIKEYTSEVKIISRLRHKNLVQLTGWCHEKQELLLVYEYMENGSLASHLFVSA